MTIIEEELKNFSWHFFKEKNLYSWAKQNLSSKSISKLFKMLSRSTYEFVNAAEYGAFSTVAKILEKSKKYWCSNFCRMKRKSLKLLGMLWCFFKYQKQDFASLFFLNSDKWGPSKKKLDSFTLEFLSWKRRKTPSSLTSCATGVWGLSLKSI